MNWIFTALAMFSALSVAVTAVYLFTCQRYKSLGYTPVIDEFDLEIELFDEVDRLNAGHAQ